MPQPISIIKVSICDISEEDIASISSSLQMEFGSNKVLAATCDVCDKTQLRKVFEETQKKFSQIDLVVNNAGIGGETNYEKLVKVNLVKNKQTKKVTNN